MQSPVARSCSPSAVSPRGPILVLEPFAFSTACFVPTVRQVHLDVPVPPLSLPRYSRLDRPPHLLKKHAFQRYCQTSSPSIPPSSVHIQIPRNPLSLFLSIENARSRPLRILTRRTLPPSPLLARTILPFPPYHLFSSSIFNRSPMVILPYNVPSPTAILRTLA